MDRHSPPWRGGLHTLADVESFETEQPLEARIPATIHQLFVEAAARRGSDTALVTILNGEEDEEPARLSYSVFLEQITRAANLFAELGGPGVGVGYILPTLMETQVVLWAAETAGYAVPLNPLLSDDHLAASNARILVVPGPGLSPQIWDKVADKPSLPRGRISPG